MWITAMLPERIRIFMVFLPAICMQEVGQIQIREEHQHSPISECRWRGQVPRNPTVGGYTSVSSKIWKEGSFDLSIDIMHGNFPID